MTLFFDLEKVSSEAGNNPDKFLKILSDLTTSRVIFNKRLVGKSFLLNPKPLFLKPKGIDKLYIIQYIQLAGRRDYSMYKLYGVKTLPLSFYPDLNYQAIKNNPLLKIENNQITFIYE